MEKLCLSLWIWINIIFVMYICTCYDDSTILLNKDFVRVKGRTLVEIIFVFIVLLPIVVLHFIFRLLLWKPFK